MNRLVLIVVAVLAGNAALASDTANIFLITHSEVRIDAESTEIWPFIVDTSKWKTLTDAELVSGTVGQIGEKQLIRGGEGERAYQFWTEIVELVPEKRKVIAIYFEERANGDINYAAWTLFAIAGETLVTYDVYSVNRVPGVAPDQVDAVREQVTAPNRTRYDAELRALKRLVEEK